MSSEIGRSRSQLILQKLFGMDAFPPAPNLSPEIVPVMEIENVPPEVRFLSGEKLLIATVAVAPTVGNITLADFINPAGSGVLAIIERIYVAHNITGNIRLNIGNTLSGTAGTPFVRDNRLLNFAGANRGACSLFGGTPAAIGGTRIAEFRTVESTTFEIKMPIVLGPNNASNQGILTISHQDITTPTIWVTVVYRERDLPQVETVQG